MSLRIDSMVLLTLTLGLWRDSSDQTSTCTRVPDLYANWKQAVFQASVSDDSVRRYLDTERPRIRNLPDPFGPIATMDSAAREAKGELVPWEDNAIMVLVAQGEAPGHLLVVPKDTFMFLADVPEPLRERLALVAATTSDALMLASGHSCGSGSPSAIAVSPPRGLGVRHLHVHVVPKDGVTAQDLRRFYKEVGRRIRNRLG